MSVREGGTALRHLRVDIVDGGKRLDGRARLCATCKTAPRVVLVLAPHAGIPDVAHACHHPIQTDTWPRLIGRVLLPVFGGANPALGRLVFDRGHDRLSDDLLETMACCVWSAHAAAAATRLNPACTKLAPMLAGLAVRVAAFLGLSREEMKAPAFADVVEGLDERFGKRLQIPALAGTLLAPPSRSVPAA